MREISDFCDMFAKHSASCAEARYIERFRELSAYCESPIEQAILAGILFATEFSGRMYHARVTSGEGFEWGRDIFDDEYVVLIQPRLGPYRPDFLIRLTGYSKQGDRERFYGVIECDGHDYHERTKAQATADKQRDRWMTERGIKVFRFTGSEIWRDPGSCTVAFARAVEAVVGRVLED